jgi:DNA transposition AAA+ family ATPase
MTKAQIERLIELERGQVDGSLEDQDLIDLGRLRQQFETWEPALRGRSDDWPGKHGHGTLTQVQL